jgi:hypothetical protein
LLFGTTHAALNGIYTINPAGGATPFNYLTFASAVSDMVSGTRADGGPVNGPSVAGPVTFNVAAATFNERVTLPAITGASAVNTITFNGAGAASTTLTWNSTTFNDYTWVLNGADFIRIQNMRVENTGATEGYGIQLLSQANNNIISNCTIALPIAATGNNQACIIAGSSFTTLGNNANNLTVQNNTLIGGRFGIVHNGSTSAYAQGLLIDNNTITDSYFAGFYFQYLNGAMIRGNQVTLRANYNGSYGAQFRNCDAFTFTRNKVLNPGLYGAYFLNCNVSTTVFAEISNNMVGGYFQTTATAYGLYFGTCNYLQIYHNSIYVNHGGTTSRGIQLAGQTAGIEILNNAVSTVASGTAAVAVYLASTAGLNAMNNNMYHSNGTNLVFLTTGYTTLAALQAGQPAYNSASQSGWPNFVSATDLHTFGVPLSNWAAPIGGFNTDFDQQTRPLAPDVVADVGADEFVLSPIDPDLVQITSPVVAAIGNNTVSVRVQNNGSGSLNGQNLSLQYSTDGGATWPVTQVFVPTTLGSPGTQQTFSFTLPWVVAASGSYVICVRINPVTPGDPDPVDQVCLSVCTGLTGLYSINNTVATGGTNYNSFADAVAALSSCGISGPVNFAVAAGTYFETFTVPDVAGASPTNTITFDGGNAATTRLFFNLTTTNSAMVTLDSADHVVFRNLTVEVPGLYGFCFHLKNGASGNRIENCRLLMDSTTTSVYQIGVLLAGNTYSTTGDVGNQNNTVRDCDIRGGYYGIRMNGPSTTSFNRGNKVIGCTIRSYYYYGIYMLNQRGPEFIGNDLRSRPSGSVNSTVSSYGLYLSYADSSFKIVGNRIRNIGAYGVYITNGNRQNNGRGLIENNMIGAGFQTTGTAYGMYLTSCVDIDIRSNSIHTGTWPGNPLYLVGSPPTSDSIRIVNNIFSAGGAYLPFGGTALRVSSAAAVKQLNYNLYYAPNGNVADFGSIQYPTLAGWQVSYPGFNQNSWVGFPGFVNETDLHIVCSDFDDKGMPGIVVPDFDGQARSATTPDIGADEFTGTSISVDLGPDTAYCGSTVLSVDSNYVAYFWDGLQGLNSIPVNNSATHAVYVIDSNNCRASDTTTITVLSFPARPYAGDTVAQCTYDSLDALNPGMTYQWSTGDTTQIIYPGVPGLYYVDITSGDGCLTQDSVRVVLFADALAQLGNDTTFCTGGGVVLNAGNGPTGTVYQWSTGVNTQVVVVSAAGLYGVTVTSPNGCLATDSIDINVLLSPVASLGPDRTVCDQFLLDPGQTAGGTYQWNTGASSQTISGTNSGLYTVAVTSPNGCTTIDQVQLTVGSTPTVNLGPDQVTCDGQGVVLSAGNPGSIYAWSTGATAQTITVTQPGTYFVTVTNPATQCAGIDQVVVSASIVNVNLGPNATLCQGESYVLDAGFGPNAYLWSTGSTSQTIAVTQPGNYSVSVTDGQGCTARDTITLTGAARPSPAFGAVTAVPLFQPVQFTDQSTGNVTSWHWDFGDGQSSVAQNPAYTYLAMGTFQVCLTVMNSTCDSTVCMQLVVGPPVEVEDAYLTQYVQVYPNPSDGHYTLAFDLPQGLDLDLEVIDLAGARIQQQHLRGVRAQTEAIDISAVANGVYFLRITSSKGHQMIAKLVKQ